MSALRRVFLGFLPVLVALALLAGRAAAQQPAAPSTEQQDEFVPVSELPPTEQLPAAPLLIGAYVVVLAAFFVYMVSVSRRLTSVQHEVQRLEQDLKRGGRA